MEVLLEPAKCSGNSFMFHELQVQCEEGEKMERDKKRGKQGSLQSLPRRTAGIKNDAWDLEKLWD